MRRALAVAGILLSVVAAAPPAAAQAERVGRLQVVVSNVRVQRGHVHIAICPQALFLKDGCPFIVIVPARQGETTTIIDNIPAGTYAAQVFLDENDNDDLDRTFIGIPEEGVGFSNNPSFTFRAPRFAEAAFRFDGVSGSISVRLRYY
ncbi:MAG TPA: DUF2141 domain-containing protein [Micropepsaceae bacterium]|jgi:uncharacterized protein (DUF2141 family)|nr:DUF2141 domain-containing protein [Micropepsaceae bacterium]